jgi:N-acetylmuramoyl-L-alanine amidase
MSARNSWRSRWREVLAAAGLAVMALSLLLLQFRPGAGPVRSEPRRQTPSGPIACVIIDAGHGGQDSGAMRSAVQEKDLTLDVAWRVARLLQAKGYRTVLTRERDEAVSLTKRAAIANDERDCVFVSIHFDEGSRAAATGVQTFYASQQLPKQGFASTWLPFLRPVSAAPANVESQSLAALVQESLVQRTQAVNRGTRAAQFFVVANVRHPAVLVEGGFLSNNDDIAKLTTEGYREELAGAISDGVLRYCEIARENSSGVADEPRT